MEVCQILLNYSSQDPLTRLASLLEVELSNIWKTIGLPYQQAAGDTYVPCDKISWEAWNVSFKVEYLLFYFFARAALSCSPITSVLCKQWVPGLGIYWIILVTLITNCCNPLHHALIILKTNASSSFNFQPVPYLCNNFIVWF